MTEVPEVAALWHPSRNQGTTPLDILPASNRKFWWQCLKGHDYHAPVYAVVTQKFRCPDCYKKSDRFWQQPLSVAFPKLISQIDESRESRNLIKTLSPKSARRVWWKCLNGHSWQTTVGKRTSGSGCPYCANQKIDVSNCFATLFPNLLTEWDFKKNAGLDPSRISPGTAKKAWWRCSRGHSWSASLSSRTRKETSTACPQCVSRTSQPEIRVLCELQRVLGETGEWRQKIAGFEADVAFPRHRLVIEVDGFPWHCAAASMRRDNTKAKALQSLGYQVFRVRDSRNPKIDAGYTIMSDDIGSLETIQNLVAEISRRTQLPNKIRRNFRSYQRGKNFVAEDDFRKLVSYLPGPEPEKSLAALYPNLVAEWDATKNAPLSPEKMHSKSALSVWWKCKKGHEWKARIAGRSHHGAGCPYCGGRRIFSGNSLAGLFPKVALDWHPTKNVDLTPDMVSAGNKTIVWWICRYGHEWQASIGNRTRGTACPVCSGRVAGTSENLLTEYPEVAAMLDAELTGSAATEFRPKSEKTATWRCGRGHIWKKKIYLQIKTGPYCRECNGGKRRASDR